METTDYGAIIATLEDKRAQLGIAIDALRALSAAPPASARPAKVRRSAPRAPKRTKAARESKSARPTEASSDSHETVLAALKDGPVSMLGLMARTTLSRYLLTKAIGELKAQKRVKVTGETTSRRIALV
ncbi:MAG: hypothetical protein Q8L86_10170 [Vicinamibacterales bacterium]|nr:hypothetical protein [Vicinamibacterales bacterium]